MIICGYQKVRMILEQRFLIFSLCAFGEWDAGKLRHKEPLSHDLYASADLDNGGSITHLKSSGLVRIAYTCSS